MPQGKFSHIRVKVGDSGDAFDVAMAVERALKDNGASEAEIHEFRVQAFSSDDMMETARAWVDPY
jgi:hypothetical protein